MRYLIVFVFFAFIVLGCKKGNTPGPVEMPQKAVLIYPAQNSLCLEGNIISANQSSILFKWSPSDNADSYQLNLKNLLTGVSTSQNTAKPELELILLRSTPYSWFVISKNSKTAKTAESDQWRFFNAGPGIESYAPFPAEIISPIKGQNITATSGKILLDWEGSDADGDVANYDVYLSTSSSPNLIKSNVTDSKLADVPVTGNTTYYWKVVTRDSKGNSSDSGIFNFKVN